MVGTLLMISISAMFGKEPNWLVAIIAGAPAVYFTRMGLQYDRAMVLGIKEEPHFHSNPLFKLFLIIIIPMLFVLFVPLFFAALAQVLT